MDKYNRNREKVLQRIESRMEHGDQWEPQTPDNPKIDPEILDQFRLTPEEIKERKEKLRGWLRRQDPAPEPGPEE